MSTHNFDLVVIGAGPGGYTTAIRSAQLKMKTAIIEKDKLGGICLNWGCIPTKALLKNAELYEHIKEAKEWGFEFSDVKINFDKVIKRSRNAADRLSSGVSFLMKKNNITVFSGGGKFVDKNTIEVADKNGKITDTIKAKHFIIATGARPREIPGVKFDGKKVISYFEAMVQEKIPKNMIIIGAGAIGVEFAYFYHSFGSNVTLVEMMPNILPIEDKEISGLLEKSFIKRGINVMTNTKVEKVETIDKGVMVKVSTAGKETILEGDLALVAIGVQGNYENLSLEKIGVKVEKSFIKVDKNYKTNIDGIYAIGDIIGPPLLAHVASSEGINAVEKIAGHKPGDIDYDSIPGCTYCQPQVGSIGLTEEKAKEKGYQIKVGRFPFRASGKAIAIGETEGLVKLIFDAKYGELLGAHILGSEATEMIAELGIAKSLEGTYHEILKTVHAHPTLAESVMEAAGEAYGEAINI